MSQWAYLTESRQKVGEGRPLLGVMLPALGHDVVVRLGTTLRQLQALKVRLIDGIKDLQPIRAQGHSSRSNDGGCHMYVTSQHMIWCMLHVCECKEIAIGVLTCRCCGPQVNTTTGDR